VPSKASRQRVAIGAAAGMRHQDIAIAMGIDRKTLAKHYAYELSNGAHARRLDVLHGLYLSAKKGSSSAARAFLAHEPQLVVPDRELQEPTSIPAPTQGAPKVVPMGKKERANAEAVDAQRGTKWDALLTPRGKMQ
jgi:hypothetical protein